MDEAKVKREARRRKILENSEKRLQKITRCKLDEDSENNTEINNKVPPTPVKRNILREPNSIAKPAEEATTESSTSERIFQQDEVFSNPMQNELPSESINHSFVQKRNRTAAAKKIKEKFWEKLGFRLVILAIVVRIVHIFKLGYLFGETIVIPFSLYMMTQLGSFQFDQNIAAGIAGPILFFIGISPNKIKNLLICYNVITSILLYFAIYFVSFVCAHLTFVTVFGF